MKNATWRSLHNVGAMVVVVVAVCDRVGEEPEQARLTFEGEDLDDLAAHVEAALKKRPGRRRLG